MAVKCGRGPHKHESVDDVRRCYNGEDVTELPIDAPTDTVVEDEPNATERQIDFLCLLAEQKLGNTDAAREIITDARNGRWGRRSISVEIGALKAMRRSFLLGEDGATTLGDPENPTESAPKAQTDAPLEAGMYRLGEDVYKVQRNVVQGAGDRAYAKRLAKQAECRICGFWDGGHGGEDHEFSPKWKFEYVQGAIHKLRPETRMTLDEAKAFGKIYGTCCVCGRTLTNETSIDEGIGPVCGGRV